MPPDTLVEVRWFHTFTLRSGGGGRRGQPKTGLSFGLGWQYLDVMPLASATPWMLPVHDGEGVGWLAVRAVLKHISDDDVTGGAGGSAGSVTMAERSLARAQPSRRCWEHCWPGCSKHCLTEDTGHFTTWISLTLFGSSVVK